MEKRNLCCEEKDQSWWKIWVKRQKHKIISSLGKKGREKICWAGRWKIHRLLAADRPPSRGDLTSGCWRYVGQEGKKYDDQMKTRKMLFSLVQFWTSIVALFKHSRLTVKFMCVGLVHTAQSWSHTRSLPNHTSTPKTVPDVRHQRLPKTCNTRFQLNHKCEAWNITRT